MKKKLIIASEFDDKLRHALMDTLAALGGDVAAHQWGLGGSQIIETKQVYLGKSLVVVEAETYVGLSISGEARLVDKVAALLALRTGQEPTK